VCPPLDQEFDDPVDGDDDLDGEDPWIPDSADRAGD
jgi:hypothetical protein